MHGDPNINPVYPRDRAAHWIQLQNRAPACAEVDWDVGECARSGASYRSLTPGGDGRAASASRPAHNPGSVKLRGLLHQGRNHHGTTRHGPARSARSPCTRSPLSQTLWRHPLAHASRGTRRAAWHPHLRAHPHPIRCPSVATGRVGRVALRPAPPLAQAPPAGVEAEAHDPRCRFQVAPITRLYGPLRPLAAWLLARTAGQKGHILLE